MSSGMWEEEEMKDIEGEKCTEAVHRPERCSEGPQKMLTLDLDLREISGRRAKAPFCLKSVAETFGIRFLSLTLHHPASWTFAPTSESWSPAE